MNFDIAGNFEVRRETTVDGNLAFSMLQLFAGNDGVARDWRKTYLNITPNSYDILIHHSADRKNWTLAFMSNPHEDG